MKYVKAGRKKTVLLLIIVASIGATIYSLFSTHKPLFIWNNTSSLPKGIYKISQGYGYGDIVAFDIPDLIIPLIKERGYLPVYDRLLKPIVAMQGDTVCIKDTRITINDTYFGMTSLLDSKGRDLPQNEGCFTVQADHVWVMIKGNSLSLDSRYYGQISKHHIYGKASLLWHYGK